MIKVSRGGAGGVSAAELEVVQAEVDAAETAIADLEAEVAGLGGDPTRVARSAVPAVAQWQVLWPAVGTGQALDSTASEGGIVLSSGPSAANIARGRLLLPLKTVTARFRGGSLANSAFGVGLFNLATGQSAVFGKVGDNWQLAVFSAVATYSHAQKTDANRRDMPHDLFVRLTYDPTGFANLGALKVELSFDGSVWTSWAPDGAAGISMSNGVGGSIVPNATHYGALVRSWDASSFSQVQILSWAES